MAVFTGGNQVLPAFARNRLNAEIARHNMASQDKQLEQADERIAIDVENLAARKEQIELTRQQLDHEKQQAAQIEFAEWGVGVFSEYEQIMNTDPEGAAEFANTTMAGLLDNLPEGSQGRERMESIMKDGTITPEEMIGFRDSMLAMKNRFVSNETPTPDNPFSKVTPKDYTQESIDRFQETGDYSVLEAKPSTTGDGSSKGADLKSPLTLLKDEDFRDQTEKSYKQIIKDLKNQGVTFDDEFWDKWGSNYENITQLEDNHRYLTALIMANSPGVLPTMAAKRAFDRLIVVNEAGKPEPAPQIVQEHNGSMYMLLPGSGGMQWYSVDQ